MKIVIDTNCLLSCIGKKSPYRNIFDAFLNQQLTICASSEMLLEYEEKFTDFWGEEVTGNLMSLFEVSDNFEYVTVHYNWNLIAHDPDDDKFIDTYVSSNADLLISNDSSILNMKGHPFPHFNILNLQEFSDFLRRTYTP